MRVIRLLGIVILSTTAAAQTAPARVRVNGVAWDSLDAAPLGGALVAIIGAGRSAVTDDSGHFHFDSIAPGTYTFAIQHDALDSAGFSGLSRKVAVTDGKADVVIALPSFSSLWRATCGNRPESADSGFVFGTVRDADGRRPMANARVEVSWIELSVEGKRNVKQTRYRAETTADARGGYAVCGVPSGTAVRAQAAIDTLASGAINLLPHQLRVRRLDLTVGRVEAHSTATGVVTGSVSGESGGPVANARVILGDLPEVRTGADGGFIFRQVPVGTRQVEVIAIGLAPVEQVVEVTANDTSIVKISTRRVAALDTVRVAAANRRQLLPREINERRRLGLGYFADSTQMRGRATLQSLFATIPSVAVEDVTRGRALPKYVLTLPAGAAGRCTANVLIDRRRGLPDELNMFKPGEIAMVEVYPRVADIPAEFAMANARCGLVVVWTSNAFR